MGMVRVLVTGARGLLGKNLTPYLQACGHEVLCHGRKGGMEVRADLSDVDQTGAALDRVAPEVIVNLAALTDVDACERNPQAAYLANVRIVENLAEWMRRKGNGCHLVQISTDQVYDGVGPHMERNVTLTNYYGFSKYAGELAATTVSSTILRTNFFGPSQSPGRLSLSDWLVQSMIRRDSIRVFDDVRFSPLSMPRLVELVEIVIRKRVNGVFNLGSKEGMSKADFAFALAETLDLPTQTMSRDTSDKIKLTAYRPKDMRMDSTRFERCFGVNLPTLTMEIHSMKGVYAHETG